MSNSLTNLTNHRVTRLNNFDMFILNIKSFVDVSSLQGRIG